MYKKLFILLIIFIQSAVASSDIQMSLSSTQKVPTQVPFITFNFSQNIFNSDKVGTFTHQPILLCSDNLEGAYEFSANNQIRLYPKKPLNASTKYICKPNQQFIPDSKAQDVSFVTQDFSIKELRYFKEGILRVTFNDQVNPKELEKYLFIFKKHKLAKTALRYTLTSDQNQKVFLAKIIEPIQDDPIQVLIKQELSSQKHKPLDKTYTSTFTQKSMPFTLDTKRKAMPIYDKPRFIALGDGRLAIRLYFPGYFYRDENPVKPYIHIKGIENFSLTDVKYIDYEDRKKEKINEGSETYVDIIADFKPRHIYTLTISKGLKDSYQFQLREDNHFTIKMGDRKPALHFEQNKPYLSSKGDISFESVNLDKVMMIIEKIPEFNYRYFVNFQKGDTKEVKKASIQVYAKELTLNNQKNRFVKHHFSLKKFTQKYQNGIFRIVMRFGKRFVQKVVYLSDIGISAKIAKDQAFISLASLHKVNPIQNATVTLFSDKNEPIISGLSNKDGICILNKQNLISQNPTVIIVKHDLDQNFLVLNAPLNKAKVIQKEQLQNRYKAWIYLQSKLIRPGSSAKMLIVLKDRDYNSARNLPVKIRILTPDFQTIYKKVHQSDEIGTIDFSIDIPQTYKTGSYLVEVKLADKVLGTTHFAVESFLPQQIENKIILQKTEFFQNEPITGKMESHYLFGAVAKNLNVEASLQAVAKEYKNDKYKDFSFTNLKLKKENKTNYIDIRNNFKLSQKGEANFYFPTATNQVVPSILEAQVGMHTFDEGKEIATYKKVTIFPYAQMAGVHILTPTMQKSDTLKASTILIDPKTHQTIQRPLQVILSKEIWHYYYDTRGYYKWEKQTQEVNRFEVIAGNLITQKIEASGDYILEVVDLLSGHSASQRFTVRGYDYNNIGPTNQINKIEILTDDKPYQRGDILHTQFNTSIIQGRLLVTLENDKVLYHKVITIDHGSAALDIPLDFDLKEGVYLDACVVRDSATPVTLIPFRSWGEKFIKADRSKHKINISLQTPNTAHSHENITVSVNCNKKSKILLSLVDNGILQIMDQKPPHPFDYFTLKPTQKVAYYDLYDQLMYYRTKGNLLTFGGDGALKMMMAQKHLAPKNAAKRVKPFMYWSHLIQTDEEGFATITIPVPQFNGKATITATAINDDSIGSTAIPLLIKDDIVIKPDYPRFAIVGDQINIPLTLFNTTSKVLDIKLHATTSDQTTLSNLPDFIHLEPKTSKKFNAILHANTTGKAECNITATTDKQSFLHTVELPVYSANILQTKVFRGESDQRTILKVPNEYFSKEGTKVKITLSKTYLAQLRGKLDDLINYPYGCTEQSASRLLALLYLKSFVKDDHTTYSKNLLHDQQIFIKEGIDKLINVQLENGDFAYWKPYGKVNPYASLYASDVLLSLHKNGYLLPDQALKKIYTALTQITKQGRSYTHQKYSNFERLYSAYLLSSYGKLDTTDINTLYDRGFYAKDNILSLYMMATILKNAQLLTPLQKIQREIQNFNYDKLSDRYQQDGDFYSKNRDIAFALYMHLHLFGKDKQAYTLLQKIANNFDKLYTTQEKAFAIRAIANYYKNQTQQDILNTKISYNDQIKEINSTTTIFDTLKNDTITLDPQGITTQYCVEVSGYLPFNQTKKHTQMLQIENSFVDETNHPIDLTQLKLGQKIYSKVTITNKEALENIAIVQRIPACFSIKNERISQDQRPRSVQNSKNFHPSFQDIRDDRILTFVNLPEQAHIYDKEHKKYYLQPSKTTFFTPIRVTSTGTCTIPPTFGEAMYDSRIKAFAKMPKQVDIH